MTKFNSDEYLKGDGLIADYQGNISICLNEITFSNLEFDEEVKININSLVLGKEKEYGGTNDKEISIFFGKDDDETKWEADFKKLHYNFSGCVFNKNMHCNPLENSSVEFDNCTFKEHFCINDGYYFENQKIKISDITIANSVFEKDFTAYKAKIDRIKIKNVDFESLSEFNDVIFQNEFDLKEISYKGFTLFDNCIFNTKAKLEYVIFEKFTSFRNSIFYKGLNLDFTSADKEINFFGIKGLENNKSKEETSQETYRIIKYNFEKIGNKIEANKYHALELDQKRRELEKNKWNNKKDYLVFKLHSWSSEHSTNWSLALLWIFAVGFLTVFSLHLDIAKDLFFQPNHFKIEYIGKMFSQFFKFIYIGNMDDILKNNSFIFLLNKMLLGYLYYQFLISVRKDTRK